MSNFGLDHLTSEQMLDLYCDLADLSARDHVRSCAKCGETFARMQTELAAACDTAIPARSEDYGMQMWARVAPLLPATPSVRHSWLRGVALWRPLSYAAAAALLLAAGFSVGRLWEHREPPVAVARPTPAPAPAPAQTRAPAAPVTVVVVLGEHLDRSERLLVELKHADADAPDSARPILDEAKALRSANREFRDSAQEAGDQELSAALDRFEKLLDQLAANPNGIDAAAITRLRKQMNADGVLFQLRVLRSTQPNQNRTVRLTATGDKA